VTESVLQVQEQRMFYHHIKCVVSDVKVCRVCKKKIGNRLDSHMCVIVMAFLLMMVGRWMYTVSGKK